MLEAKLPSPEANVTRCFLGTFTRQRVTPAVLEVSLLLYHAIIHDADSNR